MPKRVWQTDMKYTVLNVLKYFIGWLPCNQQKAANPTRSKRILNGTLALPKNTPYDNRSFVVGL